MKFANYFTAFLMALILAGCASTKVDHYSLIEKSENKRPLISDYHLKMSLVDRPVPKDQLMMLAFAEQRVSYQHLSNEVHAPDRLVNVSYVSIKGDKKTHNHDDDSYEIFRTTDPLIYKDRNSISLLGPQ